MSGAPCFDGGELNVLAPLAAINFVFGANGSGKTTVSRAFEDPTQFPGTELRWGSTGEASVKVYNRVYVEETLRQSEDLPGVFLLGAGSQEVHDEIEAINGANGSLPANRRRLGSLKVALGDQALGTGKLGEISAARAELRDAAWTKKGSIPGALQPMFVGFNNNKEKLLDHLLDVAAQHEVIEESVESLTAAANAVFDDTAVIVDELEAPPDFDIAGFLNFDLLTTSIVGSADVALSPLIEELRNADWVSRGREFLPLSHNKCPFCQQSTPLDLANQLERYFDARYLRQIEQLERLAELLRDVWQRFDNYVEQVDAAAVVQLDVSAFELATAAVRMEIASNAVLLSQKLASPSESVTLSTPTDSLAVLKRLTDQANLSIREHNTQVRNRTVARTQLLERCWAYFARTTLAVEVGRYEGQAVGLFAAKSSLEENIARAIGEIAVDEQRLRLLQSQVVSSRPIIDAINLLLTSVGFSSFRLMESPRVQDGYALVRMSGEAAGHSLSEGERTFITFLYYLHSLQGIASNDDETDALVAIIDDPISSLDSDVLFAVSALVKRLLKQTLDPTHRVVQLVVLTHNVYFHKEITYLRSGESGGGRRFFTIRKRAGQSSEIIHFAKNPVTTVYRGLWDEVKRAIEDPNASSVALQNVMRRILENYFRVLGDIRDDEIVDLFEGENRMICQALFSWVNAGSHSIIEEIDFSPSGATIQSYLNVFEAVFVRSGHEGHYRMMMRELD